MYYLNVDRFGNEILNGGGAPDFNPTPINYTPTASGNTQNLNSFVIDPAGDLYFIDEQGDSFKINTSNPLDVLTTVQPTPTATGNTTNLNSVFKDANGDTWVVDYKGDAIKAGSSSVITTLTNTVTGHKIGTYTNEAGVAVDINETITVLGDLTYDPVTGLLTIPYTDEAGVVNNKTATIASLNVLTTVQPTPAATGNTTNLNSAFKDASGNTWIVDANGDAILCGAAPFKNLNEFHVDPNGSDATGDGSQEKPFATIGKAVSVAGQGDQIIVHAGVYNENVVLSTPNVALVGAQSEYGSLTQINGTVSVTAAGTSVKIADIGILGAVSHTGTAPLYITNSTLSSTFTSSSSAYVELKNSSIQDATITKSAGSILIENSKIDNVIVSGTNTAAIIRDTYQDANTTITYGAGTIYGINNVQGGEISINASAIPVETAALAQGLSAEMAKEAETSDFQKLGMLRPDLEASPTKIVTWDEVTKRLEVSDLSAIAPTDVVKFGTTAPTAAGVVDGEEYFITSDGTSTGTVTAQYIYDKQTNTWVLRPNPELRTTSLTPVVYNNTTSSFVNAQADADVNLADLIKLSDGSYIHDGKLTFPAHGYEVGKWYYLSQTSAGAVISAEPTSGWRQQLFFVEDADTIHVDIEEGWNYLNSTSATPDFSKTVYVNATSPSTATIFDLNNPPTTNDNSLKADVNNIYIGTDGSTWTYNASTGTYKTYVYPSTTPVGFTAYMQNAQSVATSTSVIPTNYNTINTTAGTSWNPTTGVFTVPKTGWYDLSASVLYAGGNWNAQSYSQISIRKNNSNVLNSLSVASSAMTGSFMTNATVTGRLYLNAGDTISASLFQSSGSAKTINAGFSTLSVIEIK